MKAARQALRIPVPLRLIAIMLVAILIPSILITALGLFAVYQAEPMVREHLAYPIEQALDRLRERLSHEWERRFQEMGGRIAASTLEDSFFLDLAAADGRIVDVVLWREGRLRRLRPGTGAPFLEVSTADPALERARDLEMRRRDDRQALLAWRAVIADGTPEAAAEALFGSARCLLRLGEWREAVRALRREAESFGEIPDATGAVRILPALLRIIEISRDNGDPAAEQLAARDLAAELRARRKSIDPDQAAFYMAQIRRYPEALQAAGLDATETAGGAPAPPAAAGAPGASPAPGAGPAVGAEPSPDAGDGLPAGDPAWRLRALDEAPDAESQGYRRIAMPGGITAIYARFPLANGGAAYLRIDPAAYIRDVRLFTPELDLPERSLRLADPSGRPLGGDGMPSLAGHPGGPPLAVRNLPRPLSQHTIGYHPAPGELTEELRRLETSRVALFTWTIVVLVLMIVLGVSLTLRAVFREMRVTKIKSDFVGFVTHELKTPLTAIRMFTETLLLNRLESEEDRRKSIELIDQEAGRLSRLIEQILEFSRIEKHQKVFHFQSGDMAQVVDEAVRLFLEHNRDSGVQIEVNKAQERISRIKMDRAAMVELLLNLLSNALKYSRDSKKITVNVRESINDITVEVIDQGIGIPKREQKRIFEEFYRAEDYLTRDVEGTGLGLTFARYIAKVHGGDIKVSSVVHQGSTFTLELRKNQILAE